MVIMDNTVFENYLQDIEGYVIDENKIVTYKLLSKYLDVNINTAKQLLYSFATLQGNKVHSTYLVSGQLKNDKGHSVQIVREEDLQRIKDKFTTVTSEHVYSVQKAKELKDLTMLYTVDLHRREVTQLSKRLGNIKCNSTVIRPLEVVSMLKQLSQSANVQGNDKQWPAAKKQSTSGATKDGVTTTENKIKAEKNRDEAGPKEESDTKNKTKIGGIAAMFAAQSSKNKKQDEAELKTKDVANKKQKADNGISTFFSRQLSKQKPDRKTTSERSLQNPSTEVECKFETEVINAEVKEKKPEKPVPVTKEKTTKPVERKSKKKQSGTSKNKKEACESPPKKRKRIMIMSDSDESTDDEQAKEEEDERMCCSPPPQPQVPDSDGEEIIPPTPDTGFKKGRKRIRKLVDKTYMDDDGYMLTRKEYVTESCSGSEPEEENEKENKSKENGEQSEKKSPKSRDNKEIPSKEKTSPQKTKQASIMNFFKKK